MINTELAFGGISRMDMDSYIMVRSLRARFELDGYNKYEQ